MSLALIDKQDNAELVRDQIAAVLATEVENQKALATAAGKDPDLWDLKVYTERSNAWEQFRDATAGALPPIVNVWYDSSAFDKGASNIMERQKADGTFNIDCVAHGVAESTVSGHTPGDMVAALAAQRALRLVRNILMAAENTYLQMRGVVWQRWPQEVRTFQPQLSPTEAVHIVGARLVLAVSFNELSPQVPAETLDLVAAQVERAEDGAVVVSTSYDYTGV